MKIIPLVFITVMVFLFAIPAFAQTNGETTFKETCGACHTVGRGKLVGPDLANVQERQTEEWITKFIKSSQSVIKSGDKYADSLFKAYNQMPMPDHPNLSNDQIAGILTYIKDKSSTVETTTASAELPAGNSARGRDLFVGKIRFTNQGAACNSCHNVEFKGDISGGALGKDLTHAVTRLTGSGVAGIVSGLPFPQMKETYASKPVTSQEIADIVAFLTSADKQAATKTTSSVVKYIIVGGIGGLVILWQLYALFWVKRKRRTVNFSVFKRQIKSVQ